ncbi:CLUMA_CG011329, isoform A [Clunio marinus]|uniref:CLUMA_CG011329, isoform A n=1 Tax=Clunio marinus TaxID=568069 RepID=A0A1J1ICE4_9DIPT|nr:CLUMA_CG011329, isoform A [Clunio marinus]
MLPNQLSKVNNKKKNIVEALRYGIMVGLKLKLRHITYNSDRNIMNEENVFSKATSLTFSLSRKSNRLEIESTFTLGYLRQFLPKVLCFYRKSKRRANKVNYSKQYKGETENEAHGDRKRFLFLYPIFISIQSSVVENFLHRLISKEIKPLRKIIKLRLPPAIDNETL